eukprot:1133811-Pelagomonas_calceolata.AAC.8
MANMCRLISGEERRLSVDAPVWWDSASGVRPVREYTVPGLVAYFHDGVRVGPQASGDQRIGEERGGKARVGKGREGEGGTG